MVLRKSPLRRAQLRGDRAARLDEGARRRAARADPRHRPDRLGQVDHARRDDRLHQRDQGRSTSSRSRTRSRCCTSDELASINQREIGHDTNDFLSALRAALRQDPDVILIGEMRDTETVRAAIQAAETGHLVLSTLHTHRRDRDGQPRHRLLPAVPAEAGAAGARGRAARGYLPATACRAVDGKGRCRRSRSS